MTNGTDKISIRLDASLHEKVLKLVEVHPRRSKTAVFEELIKVGLSNSSPADTHIYLEAAVANLAVMLNLLLRQHKIHPDDVLLVRHFYGMLLEKIIELDGVESLVKKTIEPDGVES